MAGGNTGFSGSTVSLKIGTAVLVVVVILHVTGFSLARWSSLNFSSYGAQSSYHAGLWQHCVCVKFVKDICSCVSRGEDPAWFEAVQAMETIGLIGLIISGITSLVLLCYRRKQLVKNLNLLLLLGSGVCIIIGLIIFGVESADDLETVFAMTKSTNVKVHGSFSTSFYLCAVAAGLCIFVCFPFFVVDLRTVVPPEQQGSVLYTTQGQVIMPPTSQPQMFVNPAGMQPVGGNMPMYGHAQYVAPPTYAPRAQPAQSGIQPPPYAEGMPPKL